MSRRRMTKNERKVVEQQRIGDAAQDPELRNRLIRHHLEEASTHIGMVKQLMPNDKTETRGSLDKVSLYLRKLYIHHKGVNH